MNTFHSRDGRDGLNGLHGLHGRDGRDGRDGLNGLNGEKGDTGVCGHNGRNGRDGRDGLDGINGIDGDIGAQGAQGAQGICNCKHPNTSTFSFTTNGIPGFLYKPGSEILNILNKANMPITYIGIIWSSSGENISFFIDIKDHLNRLITKLTIGPSTNPTSKNVYEIHLNPPINSSFTRLLRFIVSKDVTLYSIMVGN